MKPTSILTSFLLILFLVISTGAADDPVAPPFQGEFPWNGAWESEFYYLNFFQNESGIYGSYEPMNLSLYDPGSFEGELSQDGKVFYGTWTETGPLNVTMSDDGMSISGIGGVFEDAGDTDPGAYATYATREEETFNPDQRWTGTWVSARTNNTWIQKGTEVTGSYRPIQGIDDEPGLFKGKISSDGRTLSGFWTEYGNFSFLLSDDKNTINGTYDLALNPAAGSDFWNATRIR